MLKEIQKNMREQDNRITAHPIFVVYDWEKIPANPLWVDEFEYADTYDEYSAIGNTKEDLINFAKEIELSLPDKEKLKDMEADDLFNYLLEIHDSLIKNHYIEKRVFVNVFFTEASAERFIKQNKHHYSDKVHIFVNSLWRNPEMQHVRELLLNGTFINNK